MINNKELQISNKNYINKDFASIYPEVIDLASTISNRWDPTTSNESDPGIVLLKEATFLSDKLNYNIDKNVLESFLPSATQENSVKMLCEMNGYNMKYYRSATTQLVFTYNGSGLDVVPGSGQTKSFTLPKYTTVVKTEDDSINYTLINDCIINSKGIPSQAVDAIEGTISSLTVGDNPTITLDNLDENNRVYFPEAMIAQNGIFVTDVDTNNSWELVDNLNIQLAKSKVYKFGYDSNNSLPYVEFPDDVASLIGNGLNIYYTITSGINGNVPANTLTVLSSPSSIYLDNAQPSDQPISGLVEDMSVNNASSSSNGANPENIDEAYNNYKKTVGTFDTLVTTRDYANYIYNITDGSTDYPIVSNVQATDRRNDFNYGNNVMTYETSTGVYKKSNTTLVSGGSLPVISPFDLHLYPLQPITSGYSETTYNQSFQPQNFNIVSENYDLNEAKCLAHNFKDADAGDVYCFKNKYQMDIKLSTYKKMNTYQQAQLVNNVKLALYKAFNAREVDFGDEIPLDAIKKVIKQADTSISDIATFNVEVHPYVMTRDGAEISLDAADASVRNNIIAKNILSGSISLFDYNDTYSLSFGQQKVNYLDANYSDIKYMSTELFVPYNAAPASLGDVGYGEDHLNKGYTLKTNELIQFISPTLVSEITYPQYVNYRYEGSRAIEKNEIYELSGNDTLTVLYTDANTNIEYKIIYKSKSINTNGTITTVSSNLFKPNFRIEPIEDSDVTLQTITKDGVKYLTLGATQQIEKQVYSETKLTNNILYCYWILNDESNILFHKGDKERLLDNNEYFMYTNAAQSELVILGSGTQLNLESAAEEDWAINSDLLDIEEINNRGLGAFASNAWYIARTLEANPLTIKEMDIISFAEGDVVTIKGWGNVDEQGRSIVVDGDIDHLRNAFVEIPNDAEISAISNGEIVDFPKLYSSDATWKVRSRLNVNSGPTLDQYIGYNHRVEIKTYSDENYVPLYDPSRIWYDVNHHLKAYFKLNLLTQLVGGYSLIISPDLAEDLGDNGVNMLVRGTDRAIKYPKNTSDVKEVASLSQASLGKNSRGMIPIQLKGFGNDSWFATKNIVLPLLPIKNKSEYILFYYDYQCEDMTEEEINLTVESNSGANLNNLNTGETATVVKLKSGINVIELPYSQNNPITSLILRHDVKSGEHLLSNDTVYVGEINISNGYNKMIPSNVSMNDVLARMKELSTDAETNKDIFYYVNRPVNDKSIDVENILSPEAFWDYNNVANNLTIGELDFTNSVIDLLKTSKA